MKAPRMYHTLTYRCSARRAAAVRKSESPISPPPTTSSGAVSQRFPSSHSIPSL